MIRNIKQKKQKQLLHLPSLSVQMFGLLSPAAKISILIVLHCDKEFQSESAQLANNKNTFAFLSHVL